MECQTISLDVTDINSVFFFFKCDVAVALLTSSQALDSKVVIEMASRLVQDWDIFERTHTQCGTVAALENPWAWPNPYRMNSER